MEKFVPFLKTVAEDLVEKNGGSNDFSKLTIVFPNKRARLFMNKYLLDAHNERQGGQNPLWAPAYATSSNLLEYLAHLFEIPLTIVPDVDKFQLVQLLFHCYQQEAQKKLAQCDGQDEVPRKVLTKSLDEFYFLGEIILNDFNDIDKHLADAQRLFRNFNELRDLETLDYLTSEQVKAIRDFLKRDFQTDTALFKGFITLWELLGGIYTAFREQLAKRGLAYAGMLHRMVAEKLNDKSVGLPQELPNDLQFAFVGFNALNGCEKALLKKLSNRQLPDGRPAASFYWDYDTSYFDPSGIGGEHMLRRKGYRDDAGTFLRANIGGFSAVSHTASQERVFLSLPNTLKNNPNELNPQWQGHSYLQRLADGRHVKVLAASTDTAQTKYVSKFISDLKDQGVPDDDIAIVLCDEKLLPAVLHSIPQAVERLNVTMGFPIVQTPAYALVHLLVQLQLGRGRGKRFSYANVMQLIRCDILRKWQRKTIDVLINQMSRNARTYLGAEDIMEFIAGSGRELSAENAHFIELLFSTGCKVGMEDEADGLLKWLLQVMGSLAAVYKREAAKNVADEEEHNFGGLYEEAFYQVFRMVNCLYTAQAEPETDKLTVALCVKLLGKMFASAKVPYSGEPARGMQVMGFLEMRSLDFKHVLMLSVGEGYMPKASFAPSFIPYALRIGFDLPAIEHEDALYAYNFFRALQRPATITLAYNASAQTGNAEQSRFVRQLKEEYRAFDRVQPIAFADAATAQGGTLRVNKTDADIAYLKERYGYMPRTERLAHNEAVRKGNGGTLKIDLSPSALNSYLDCQLRFYFRYIKHLSADDEFDMDIDEAYFGRIFHKTMELIYTEIAGKTVDDEGPDWHAPVAKQQLVAYLKTERMEKMVDRAFAEEFNVRSTEDYTGIQLIKRDVLVEMVRKQVEHDVKHAENGGFTIYKPEFAVSQPVVVEMADNSKFALGVGGILDRRDMKDGVMRVVDYKTGGDADGHKRCATDLGRLFSGGSKRADKVFQAVLYSCLWNMKEPGCTPYNQENRPIVPVLMFPRQMNDKFDPELQLGKGNKKAPIAINCADGLHTDVEQDFMVGLKNTLRQLLNKGVPFEATTDEASCTFCDFKAICHKED